MTAIARALITLLLLSSCSSLSTKKMQYLSQYHEGKWETAEASTSRLIRKHTKAENGVRLGQDSIWLLLDRGMVRLSQGKGKEATADFEASIGAMKFYLQPSCGEDVRKLAVGDLSGAYTPPPFEQVLARLYYALALLYQDDQSNAYALLRQAEEVSQEWQELHPKTSNIPVGGNNPVCKALFSELLARKGDFSNAKLLREKSLALAGSLPPLALRQDAKATIVLLCHNGKIPVLESVACPATGTALAIVRQALEDDPDDCHCLSLLADVPVPVFIDLPFSHPRPPVIVLEGQALPFGASYNVAAAAEFDLAESLPGIIGSGIARLLMRQMVVEGAAATSDTAGSLADGIMLIANLATKADTRSWSTLPRKIMYGEARVPPGVYRLEVVMVSQGIKNSYAVSVEKGDLCVINIFNPSPTACSVLVPPKFLASEINNVSIGEKI